MCGSRKATWGCETQLCETEIMVGVMCEIYYILVAFHTYFCIVYLHSIVCAVAIIIRRDVRLNESVIYDVFVVTMFNARRFEYGEGWLV